MNCISATATTISIELNNNECFFSGKSVDVLVGGEYKLTTDRNVFTIYDLKPGQKYDITIKDDSQEVTKIFETEKESYVLDVTQFGAKGDGVTLDTPAIQAAVASCPANGRIYFPKGTYLSTPIFLKSDITLELHKEATLLGVVEKEAYPTLPGIIKDYSEENEAYLGSWEGDPALIYASLLTGINLQNVKITGQGTIDGNARHDTWWHDEKNAYPRRPKLIYFNNCEGITLEGVTVKNSPSWTIHPYMSRNLKFIGLHIINPMDSPNTDGINPEFCSNVLICGVRFSVGDDCIAIKSGKLFMGEKGFEPSHDIFIRNNLMEFGHGAVVIGSEIAGGVRDVYIEKCLFIETDRGLRIKTRRGRGKASVVDNICMKNVKMDKVLTPFVMNMFYFCDPDGKTEYVWSKEKLPVDHRTPTIGRINVENVTCKNAQIAAAYMYGLPENKIKEVNIKNVSVHMSDDAVEGYAAMMSYIPKMRKNGMYFNNIEKINLENVELINVESEKIVMENVDTY